MLIAADEYNLTSIVRIVSNDPASITRTLDAGAQVVVVPRIKTKEEAILAIKATKYPPEGTRGWGGGHIRSNRWQGGSLTLGEEIYTSKYIERMNHLNQCIPLLEDPEAYENLEDILSTPGLDFLFPGPGDLSVALGFSQQLLMKALDDLYFRCKEKGIGLIMTYTEENVHKWYPGCSFLMGVDALELNQAISRKLYEAKKYVSSQTGS
jgi:4-hydroxy-2-oxoheptanedioate aldolase